MRVLGPPSTSDPSIGTKSPKGASPPGKREATVVTQLSSCAIASSPLQLHAVRQEMSTGHVHSTFQRLFTGKLINASGAMDGEHAEVEFNDLKLKAIDCMNHPMMKLTTERA